jgi:alpha-galactosidase
VIPSGHSVSATYQVTAPKTAPPITSAALTGSDAYTSLQGNAKDTAELDVPLVSPVRSPYLTANTTGANALFGQSGNDFAISAAGAGVAAATTRAAATDGYGAIYQHGATATSTVETTVTAQAGTARGAKAGLIMRNDATAADGSPEGVVLYVTGSGQLGMAWNATGGATVDTTTPTAGAPTATAPVHLRLVRDGSTYTGYYSTDGTTWTQVGTATVAAAAAGATQDAGLFHTAASASATEAEFTGFDLS